MPKSATVASLQKKQMPSVEQFREAVKYILVHDDGMPDLVAEEILSADADFLESKRKAFPTQEGVIAKTAESLMYEPTKGVEWVRLEKGMRTADDGDVVIVLDGKLEHYMDSLLALGCIRDAVAKAMLVRGIEAVFPLLKHGK